MSEGFSCSGSRTTNESEKAHETHRNIGGAQRDGGNFGGVFKRSGRDGDRRGRRWPRGRWPRGRLRGSCVYYAANRGVQQRDDAAEFRGVWHVQRGKLCVRVDGDGVSRCRNVFKRCVWVYRRNQRSLLRAPRCHLRKQNRGGQLRHESYRDQLRRVHKPRHLRRRYTQCG